MLLIAASASANSRATVLNALIIACALIFCTSYRSFLSLSVIFRDQITNAKSITGATVAVKSWRVAFSLSPLSLLSARAAVVAFSATLPIYALKLSF